MNAETILEDVHNGLIVNPSIIILAKALEAERDSNTSSQNKLKMFSIWMRSAMPAKYSEVSAILDR